jgi:MFS transporter, AAHS family, 4-hydroxybenzoate transporter
MQNRGPARDVAWTVDEIIDRLPLSRLQKIVIALCALVTAVDGFDAQAIGFLASPIAETFRADVRSFGPMFSCGLLGLMTGTLIMGPFGDRWGRKRALIVSAVSVGAFTFFTGFAQSVTAITALRFFTGFGLGGAMPSSMSLIAEYSPARLRPSTICLAAACIPVGSMSAGICASVILPHWGWRPMFFLGGIIPLILAAAIIVVMPESVRFLKIRGGNEEQARRILAQIWPASAHPDIRLAVETSSNTNSRFPVVELFRDGRRAVTPLLWTAYFMNLLVLYFVVSWIPALLRASGFSNSTGVLAISLFGCGGIIGSLTQGWFGRQFKPHRILVIEFVIFIALTLTLAIAKLDLTVVAIAAFGIGWVIQGAQAGLNVFAATIYPTIVRSTGIGWGLGVGRIGSIVGPLLGGWALLAGWSSRQIFAAGAVPAVLAAAAVISSAFLGISKMSDTDPSLPAEH